MGLPDDWKIRTTENIKMQPGITVEDIIKFTKPKGLYAYSRLALMLASGALIQWIEAASLKKKFLPELSIQSPCPPLFNAFFEPSRVIETTAGSLLPALDSGDWEEYYEQRGKVSYGTLRMSDAIADTYLYLGQTRKYFLEALHSTGANSSPHLLKSQAKAVSKKIPTEVIKEIKSLFHAWDHWQLKDRLDFSKSLDIPPIDANAEPEELSELIAENHYNLVVLLFIALDHEYGHLLQLRDKEVGEKMSQRSREIVSFFLARGQYDLGFSVARYEDLLKRDQNVFDSWQVEVSCDIFALESSLQCFGFDKAEIFKALAILCLIFSIVEIYNNRKYSALSVSHPVSFIRFYLDMIHLSNLNEWDYPEGTTMMFAGIATIIALQSQLLSS